MRHGLALAALLLPAAALARQAEEPVLVYFSWDSSEISDHERPKLDALVAALAKRRYREVVVEGHSDRSVSPDYAFVLSDRMAQAVRDRLVDSGVDCAKVAARGLGAGIPRVETAQGVREVQNRRVEIRVVWE